MRRTIAGSIPLIASIVIPATFQGSLYLIALWGLMALGGLYLIGTSDPVKKPLIAALRRELLPLDGGAPGSEAEAKSSPAFQLRLAISAVSEELEAANEVLTGPYTCEFFVNNELATARWEYFGPTIAAAAPPLHKTVRAAYRAIKALNTRGITRGLHTVRRGPTTDVDSTLSQQAKAGIQEAIEQLEAYAAKLERLTPN